LLREISTANVACGGHAGDAASMSAVCAEAACLGVAIGAQVSYPDRQYFGRVAMDIDHDELMSSLSQQFSALVANRRRSTVLDAAGGRRPRYIE